MKFILPILACVLACVALTSCADETIPDRRLINAYSDVIIAREMYGDSALVDKAIDSALSARDFGRDEFDVELRTMTRSPQLFKAFYDSVTAELTRRRDSLNSLPDIKSPKSDSGS